MTHETTPGPRGLAAQILAEAELSRQLEAYQGYSDNVWSMGRVADLLWRHSESARPLIRKTLVDALDEALQRGEMPMVVSDGVLLLKYCGSVLRPLLDNYPDSAEELQQELQMIRYVAPYRGLDSAEYVTDLFDEYVVYWLRTDRYRPIVEDCDPEIAAIVFDNRN
ncbi:hypothetical protein [Glycomyces dulcitolivorans]|uniref:hypothetical protein n=1 Tax=Glycomyces dulcitolivorans TaxID=2200759 RepID=UPI0013007FB0|nr:hypothetical protein [Glycomyces dulcitolivorans]